MNFTFIDYSNPETNIRYKFVDASSPLFDPVALPDVLKGTVHAVYKELAEHHPDLADTTRQRIILGWYTADDRFRIAVRSRTQEFSLFTTL